MRMEQSYMCKQVKSVFKYFIAVFILTNIVCLIFLKMFFEGFLVNLTANYWLNILVIKSGIWMAKLDVSVKS